MTKLPFALAFLIAWLLAFAVVKRVVLHRVKKWVGSSKAHWAPLVLKGMSWPLDMVVLILGLMFFIDILGISITPLLASLGIGSLAVALALQDSLSNFFAGLYVAIDRPVEAGQYVRLEGGQEGFVTDVGWRSTRIRTTSNTVIVISNAKLMGGVITNFDLPERSLQVTIDVGVHYDSDLERVERVVLEVAREVTASCPFAQRGSEPGMAFKAFGESSVDLTAVLWADQFADAAPLKHAFIKKLHARFKKEGIAIPYPTRTLVGEALGR
jgi:small-conductance mechanosensitive channel